MVVNTTPYGGIFLIVFYAFRFITNYPKAPMPDMFQPYDLQYLTAAVDSSDYWHCNQPYHHIVTLLLWDYHQMISVMLPCTVDCGSQPLDPTSAFPVALLHYTFVHL